MDKDTIITQKRVNWRATGRKLEELRRANRFLRENVCYYNKSRIEKTTCKSECCDCATQIDNSISRRELGDLFGLSPTVIGNYETGRSFVPYEVLLFYCQLSGLKLEDIIVFEEK